MNEFENMMYCPFCDKYEPKNEIFCVFCLYPLTPYNVWNLKSDKSKEKWKEKQKPFGIPRTPKEIMELPEDTYNKLMEHEKRINDFDARYREYLAEKDIPHIPKCPTCGSPNLSKIGAGSKLLDVAFWGFASGKVRKTFHCDDCGYEW